MILVGPPDTGADSLTGRDDKGLSEIISAPGYPTNPRRIPAYDRHSLVKNFNLVFDAFGKVLLKHYPIHVSFAFKFELRVAVHDLCNCQRRLQIDLHFASGFQSLENYRVG